jgi:hypothetical protein
VYLLGGPVGVPTVTIAEWDLARANAVHRAVLPEAPDYETHVVANEGGALHIANIASDGRSYYTRLSPDLKVVSRTRMDSVRGHPKTIASDGAVTAIAGCNVFMEAAGPCFVATYDERGAPIAHDSIDGDLQEFYEMHDGAAVVGGNVYLLLYRHGRLHIVELARDLIPITSSIVPAQEEYWSRDSTLRARGDRLVVDVPPAQYEFSPDLTEVREVPRAAPPEPRFIGHLWCPDHVRVGPVDAFWCWRNAAPPETFVAWDRFRSD